MLNSNTPILNRKEWQMMTPSPVTTGAGMFVAGDEHNVSNLALYVTSNTVVYLYHHDEDGFIQIPSPALAGTFGAGACGKYHPWSVTYTANGGSTTTITVASASFNLTGLVRGQTVEFLNGANIGLRRTITQILVLGGTGNITLTLDSAVTAVVNNDTFRVSSGRFYIIGAGTLATGSFRELDLGTLVWTSKSITNLPATWGTDGRMVVPYNITDVFASGTATSATGTTLSNSAKNWEVNGWTNYQVRITGGVGIGQVRVIASNTATQLTVATWTTTPDATSTYAIEQDENAIYLLGNGAVAMYKFSISGNAWTAMSPTTARTGAPSTGMSANHICCTGDTGWADETAIKDGRYIFSFRGGVAATLDRFDIAGGTAGAGAWLAITYVGTETFTTGSSACANGRYIYLRKDATNRFFKYSVRGNYIEALNTNIYTDGAALLGNKIWIKDLDGTGNFVWLYSLQNTGTVLHRLLLF